ncbi:unnamed protein product, partial [Prorocentrum cordatum]
DGQVRLQGVVAGLRLPLLRARCWRLREPPREPQELPVVPGQELRKPLDRGGVLAGDRSRGPAEEVRVRMREAETGEWALPALGGVRHRPGRLALRGLL